MIRLLHVEDDDTKARSVGRLIASIARRRGLEVEVIRVVTLAEAVEYRYVDFAGVVTDWCFPTRPGAAVVDGLGASVSEKAAEAGIPAVVVSGGMRFPSYAGHAIWCDDWNEGLYQLFDRVVSISS